MKGFFTAKRLCRAGIIAALYVALTYSFGAIAYNGFLQIRPAEALCILPLFLSRGGACALHRVYAFQSGIPIFGIRRVYRFPRHAIRGARHLPGRSIF